MKAARRLRHLEHCHLAHSAEPRWCRAAAAVAGTEPGRAVERLAPAQDAWAPGQHPSLLRQVGHFFLVILGRDLTLWDSRAGGTWLGSLKKYYQFGGARRRRGNDESRARKSRTTGYNNSSKHHARLCEARIRGRTIVQGLKAPSRSQHPVNTSIAAGKGRPAPASTDGCGNALSPSKQLVARDADTDDTEGRTAVLFSARSVPPARRVARPLRRL